MRLTESQIDALRNLSAKEGGAAVGWISIATARGLTDLGFAHRTQAGWRITPAGAAALDMAPLPDDTACAVVRGRFADHAGPLEQ